MTQNGPETTPASPLQTLCCCSRMKARFLSRSRLAPSSASSSVSIPSLPFIFVSRQRCNISKKRILYSLSAVLNKVLWYHWAEVLTHTHTQTDWRHTLSLAVPSHLLRSPASHSHSNTRPDGITPACRAEQSAPVHFPDAAGGHDDTRRANNVGLSCCRRFEILQPQSALLKRSGRDCYTENKPELITFSD